MPRLPTRITFICEGCQKSLTVKQIHNQHGNCQRCPSSSWTLVVDYTDTELNVSPGLSLLGGFSVDVSAASYTNQVVMHGISAEIANQLTEDQKAAYERVEDHLRLCQREARLAQGAKTCLTCNALFSPTLAKSWTQKGYCSKLCHSRASKEDEPVSQEPVGRNPKTTLSIQCPDGHEFEVMASFRGCVRPCPQCGKKCQVK